MSSYLTLKTLYTTGGKHKARRPNPALHIVLSGPAPCFYPAAVPSSRLTIKESLHVYSPKITFGPLKATVRLMWPPGENEFDVPTIEENHPEEKAVIGFPPN